MLVSTQIKSHWIYLLFAIGFEVMGSAAMKLSSSTSLAMHGLLLMYLLIGFSYFFLGKAIVGIPVGVAYTFWEATGLLLITLFSVLFLEESMTVKKAIALLLLLSGSLLLHNGTERGDNGGGEK